MTDPGSALIPAVLAVAAAVQRGERCEDLIAPATDIYNETPGHEVFAVMIQLAGAYLVSWPEPEWDDLIGLVGKEAAGG